MGRAFPDIKGGSGDLAAAEDSQGRESARLTQGGQDDTPQTGPFGDMITAVARTANDLCELKASAGTTNNLCGCAVVSLEHATWSPGPPSPKDLMSRFSDMLCRRYWRWYCGLRGCGWAQRARDIGERIELNCIFPRVALDLEFHPSSAPYWPHPAPDIFV